MNPFRLLKQSGTSSEIVAALRNAREPKEIAGALTHLLNIRSPGNSCKNRM